MDAETAEEVLRYLSESGLADRLHAESDRLQEKMNADFAADDERMTALAAAASEEEISEAANQLADKYAGDILRAASGLLAEIDGEVSGYITSLSR